MLLQVIVPSAWETLDGHIPNCLWGPRAAVACPDLGSDPMGPQHPEQGPGHFSLESPCWAPCPQGLCGHTDEEVKGTKGCPVSLEVLGTVGLLSIPLP